MYKVKLQSFEGPFDLLVYLIESAEMSIYDIRISEITSQYLEYIKAMEEQNIEVAQEFMVLAASLIEIKSRMILPRITEEGETVIEKNWFRGYWSTSTSRRYQRTSESGRKG